MRASIYWTQHLKWWQRSARRSSYTQQYITSNPQQGFTMIEVLLVVLIIGILAAIATPSWIALLNNNRLNAAQNTVSLAIEDARSKAKQRKTSWEAKFKEESEAVWWSVQSADSTPNWQKIEQPGIKLEPTPATNLGGTTKPLTIQFNDKGQVLDSTQMGKITLSLQNSSPNSTKRCVIVATLLGVIQTAKDAKCN